MQTNGDNRKVDMMQILEKFVFPAIMVAGTAVFSVQTTLSTVELDVDYIKRDVERQSVALAKFADIQLDVIALQIEVKNGNTNMAILTGNVERLRDRIRAIEGDTEI